MPIIDHKSGDLLEQTQFKTIAHGVNCQGVMGSGIAVQIKKKYPEYFIAYKDHVNKKYQVSDLLGEILITGNVIHCFTQLHYGSISNNKFVSYDAVHSCFKELNHLHNRFPYGIAIPKIGSGLGGGSWDVICNIIEDRTPNLDITVYSLMG